MGGTCGTYGGEKNAYVLSWENLKGKTPFGRHWHRWHDCTAQYY